MPRKSFFLFILLILIQLPVDAQEWKRTDVIAELEFKTERRDSGRFEVATGYARSLYREYDSVEFRSAEEYLKTQYSRFGWSSDARELVLEHDRDMGNSRHVTYQQMFAGYPVIDHRVRVNMDRIGRVSLVLSSFVPVSAEEGTFNVIPGFSGQDAEADVLQHFAPHGGRVSAARLVVTNPGAPRLAWEVFVWPNHEPSELRILVDAHAGKIISVVDQSISLRSEIVPRRVDGTGFVYDPGPLMAAGALYGAPFVDNGDATNADLDAVRKEIVLLDISQNASSLYVLEGPYVTISGLGSGNLVVYTPPSEVSPDGFVYDRSQSGFEAVNAYYHIDKSQRYVQSLGILGRQQGPILVNPQGLTSDDSRYTPNDNRILFGTGGVDDAEDPTVIWHEYAHALLESGAPGLLGTSEGHAYHEGWADYWAASHTRSQVEGGLALRSDWRELFVWDTGDGSIWDGRTLDHEGIYPQDVCVTHSSGCNAHDDGRMWATTQMEVYDRLGRATTDQLNLLSHQYLIAPVTFADAGEALIQADLDYNSGSNVSVLIDILGRRGLVDAGQFAPVIQHEPLPNTDAFGTPVSVLVHALGVSASISTVELIYESTSQGLTSVLMTSQGTDEYRVMIDLPSVMDTVFYYIRAQDLDGRTSYLPEGAPAERFRFFIGVDLIPPVITHQAKAEAGFVDWPLVLQAEVTDNLAVESVVIEYAVFNASGVLQSEAELAMSGDADSYTVVLNVPFGQLEKDGILRYAIRATDSSLSANVGRSPENGFFESQITATGDLRRLDFEDGDFTSWTRDGVWEEGIPSYGGETAISGQSVIAVNLDGAYPEGSSVNIIELAPINLGRLDSAFLTFWHYYDTENDGSVTPDASDGTIYDGGLVQIRSASNPEWSLIEPLNGYPGRLVTGGQNAFQGNRAFGGFSHGWRHESFELPVEDDLQIRFVFATNNANSRTAVAFAGWLIDDMVIGTVLPTESNDPVVLSLPPPELIVAVDDVHSPVAVEAFDETGISDAFMDWSFKTRIGTTTGTSRMTQDPVNLGKFVSPMDFMLGAEAGDEVTYRLRLSDPFGNTVRLPGVGPEFSVKFRLRNTTDALTSVWASGAWFQENFNWRIQGGEIGVSSLNMRPFMIPDNALRSDLVLEHTYTFGTRMGGRLDVSDDGGASWTILQPRSRYPGLVSIDELPSMNNNPGFVGLSGGGLVSTFDLQAYRGKRIQIRVLAGSSAAASSKNHWYINEMSLIVESEDQQFESMTTSEILPNHPNPFSDRTNISYVLHEATDLDIRVFDMLGREVAWLISRFTEAGSHSVVFDRGRLVPGIYFVRMRTNGAQKVRKIVIAN